MSKRYIIEPEYFVLERVLLPSVLSSTIVRAVIQLNSERAVEEKLEELSFIAQTKEMYEVSSNKPARTVTLEYRCSGWPSEFVLSQLEKIGRLFIKVIYMPHSSLVNKAIAEEMEAQTEGGNVWYDVLVRGADSSYILEWDSTEQPAATKESVFEIRWTARRAHVPTTLNKGKIFLDSKLRPVSVVEKSKERVVFNQVESVSSVVDAVLHLTSMDGKDSYSESNVTFDIDPRKFKWSDIPLNFIFYYDIQTRLHSPSTLRVFFVRRELKHDKTVTSLAGRKTV